jgi:hypothetical protein
MCACTYLHCIKTISTFILKLDVPRNPRVRSVATCVRVIRAARRQVLLQLLTNQMSETNHLHQVPLHLHATVTKSQERCHRTLSSGFSSEEFEAGIIYRVDDVRKTFPVQN